MTDQRPEWLQRVINEKAELDDRLVRLGVALLTRRDLDPVQRDLMDRQRAHMKAYSLTLRDRIDAAKGDQAAFETRHWPTGGAAND